MTSQKTSRLDYLDATRAFALILGIIFHASISFMPIFIGWAVMDISTSSIVPTFMMISHSFRLALFFLIAGFFSHMKFHIEGVQLFLKSRIVRIVIPFIIGWLVLRPMLVSAWIMGAESMRGEANILNAIKTGCASLGDLPKDLLIGTHLLVFVLPVASQRECPFNTLSCWPAQTYTTKINSISRLGYSLGMQFTPCHLCSCDPHGRLPLVYEPLGNGYTR